MSAVGARFDPSPAKANVKASGFFGGGESGPARFGAGVSGASMTASSGGVGGVAGSSFGQGMAGLSSLEEKEEEEAAVSPMNGEWSVGAGAGVGPASFERLRQAER